QVPHHKQAIGLVRKRQQPTALSFNPSVKF
ncbi:MAG: hypothetical protein ACI9HB_003445, partial [Gammaproteobacteria bacterium]